MRNAFLLIICLLIFFSNGCNNIKTTPHSNNEITIPKLKVDIDDGFWRMRKINSSDLAKKGDNLDRELKAWSAKSFESRGELQRIIKIGDSDMKLLGVSGFPNGWLVNNRYFIDPETGNETDIDETDEKHLYSGPTDGEYVFGDDYYHRNIGGGICWKLDDNSIIWTRINDSPMTGSRPYKIVGNKLVSINTFCQAIIKNINPWTGEEMWSIEGNSMNAAGKIVCPSDNKIYVVFNFHDGDKILNSKLYAIGISNADTIDIKTMALNHGDARQAVFMKDKLWIYFNKDLLICFDPEKQSSVAEYKIEEKKYVSFETIGNSILFDETNFQSNKLNTEILFNTKSGKVNYIEAYDAFVSNNSLIIREKNQTRCVDPDTLETIWSINEPDCEVLWQDWRGVLARNKEGLFVYNTK